MKQKTSGMIAFLGMLALAGCYSYASESINNASYNTVQATPFFAKVNVGDSDQILVRLVNAANNGALTSYTLGTVPAGIQVHFNANYRPVWNSATDSLVATGDKTAQQYYVVGVTPGKYSFTLTPTSVNTAVSTTITVVVSPIDLGAALSTTTGLHAGDTVTITLPAGVVFNRTAGANVSVPSFDVGPAPAVVSFAADSSSMKILVAPGDSGKVTVTHIGQTNATAAPLLSLASTNAIAAVPAITVVPTTVSTTTPALGTGFTATLGNGLRIMGNTHVFIGGTEAGVTNVSADSSTATITPMPGSSGLMTFTNVALSFLTSVPLALPGDKSVTVGSTFAGPTSAGANSPTTADTISFVGSRSTVLADGGTLTTTCPSGVTAGLGSTLCRFYKINVPAAGAMSANIRWSGSTTSDMAVILVDSTGVKCAEVIADNNGAVPGTTGDDTNNLNCTEGAAGTAPSAGPAYLVVLFFQYGGSGSVPPWYMVRFSQP